MVSPSRETSKLDQGQDLIEYSLLLTMILLFSVVTLEGMGCRIASIFTAVNTAMSSP